MLLMKPAPIWITLKTNSGPLARSLCNPLHVPDWVGDGRPVLATAGAGRARHFHKWATTAPEVAFAWLHRAH
jgi:hypothetical protein